MEILNIALYDLKKLTRERTALIITFLMPVIFIVIMGSVNFGNGATTPAIPIGIVNYDNGKASTDLLNEVGKDNALNIRILNENQLMDAVKNADVDAGFIIPENFSSMLSSGSIPEIKVLKLPSSADFMVIEEIISDTYSKLGAKNGIQAYFNEKMKKLNFSGKDVIVSEVGERLDENLQKPALVSVESKSYSENGKAKKIDSREQYTLGFIIMFVMWAVVFSAGETLEEKKTNTWGRLNITPAGKHRIILGKILGTFLRGWVQVIFLILFSKFVMGITWGDSVAAIIIIVSIYLLCVNSFGMFLSSMVRTNAQLGAISSIIITCTCMLAGCYWPLEIVPDYMQKAARIFPQYWAMKGLTATAGNQGLGAIAMPVLVLAGMGLLFFLLSIIKGVFRFRILKPAAQGNC